MLSPEMSMPAPDLKARIEFDAIVDAPVYCDHRRGKNWLARISIDPSAPGGLAREFMPRARGGFRYIVRSLSPGDAVEFGADYYTSGGNRRADRAYGFVGNKTENEIWFYWTGTAREAVERAQAWKSERARVSADAQSVREYAAATLEAVRRYAQEGERIAASCEDGQASLRDRLAALCAQLRALEATLESDFLSDRERAE